jgi:hypothetical protein
MSDIGDLLTHYNINIPSQIPGRYTTTCPWCSASRKPNHRRNKVLGVTITNDGRVYFGCNHCHITGPTKGVRDELPHYDYPNDARKTRVNGEFAWEHRNGAGDWENGSGGSITKLYRIDEAIETGGTILVCEGEKDVDNLWTIGFPAVCHPHGAGNWTAEHSRQLAGRSIVVLNDNDEPGYKYAAAVVKHSLSVAASVRRLDLKDYWPEIGPGQDVSDWLEHGGGSEEWLERIIAELPEIDGKDARQPASPDLDSAADLKGMTFMPLKWIVPGYIPEGVTLLAGKPKVGKSWLMLATALAASMARAVLGEACEKRNVLYCALEDTRRRMRSRIEAIIGMNDIWPDNLRFAYDLPTLDHGGIERLQQMIDKYGVKVAIIDTLARFRGQRLKQEEQYQCDYRTMTALNDLAKKNDVAVIVVHHVRKQTAEDVFDTISGTMGLSGAADTLVILTRAEEELRLVVRGRDVEPEDKIVDFDLDTGTWSVSGDYEGKDGASASNARTLILSTLSTAKYSMKPNDIAEKTGLSKSTTRGTLRRMQRAGEVSRTQYGTYEKPRVS